MPRILVTNDDGYRSEGIHALAEALRALGDVTVVAPVEEASAIGHALTLRRPLRLETIADRTFAVDGTPTDCVNIAITQVFKGLPDLVVSGINKGWNLGDDVTYSGTVAGALEGALLGIPSIAVSLRATRGDYDFSHAARAAASFAGAVLRRPLPPRTFLNVNVPKGRRRAIGSPCRPSAITSPRSPSGTIRRGGRTTGLKRVRTRGTPHDRSDYQAVRDGYVSVTPLHPDLTAYDALQAVEDLSVDNAAEVR